MGYKTGFAEGILCVQGDMVGVWAMLRGLGGVGRHESNRGGESRLLEHLQNKKERERHGSGRTEGRR